MRSLPGWVITAVCLWAAYSCAEGSFQNPSLTGCPVKWTKTVQRYRLMSTYPTPYMAFGNKTRDECQTLCEQATLFTCLSATYNRRQQACYLDSVTKDGATHKHYKKDRRGIYMERRHICEDCTQQWNTRMENTELWHQSFRELQVADEAECIQACEAATDAPCVSYNYRPSRRKCVLNSAGRDDVWPHNRMFGPSLYYVFNDRSYDCAVKTYTFHTPDVYGYHIWLRPVGEVFAFRVQSCYDAHIALSAELGTSESTELYEVVIGGWSGTKSAIRKESGTPTPSDGVVVETPGILSCDEMRPFYITWGPPTGNIALYKGEGDGGELVASWTDPQPRDIKYVSISSWVYDEGDWEVEPSSVFTCDPSPCQNGGMCLTGVNYRYTCSCAEGFSGPSCENIKVDPCGPNPCQNGGECSEAEDVECSFICACASGFKGATCTQVETTTISLHTPLTFGYSYRFVSSGRIFSFLVRACNDVHVALFADLGETQLANMYEVVISGWGNTQSAIRKQAQGPNNAAAPSPGILDCTEARPFYVVWGEPAGRIALFQGEVGLGILVVEWTDPSPRSITAVSVSTGWGSEGDWQVDVNIVSPYELSTPATLAYNQWFEPLYSMFAFQVRACSDAHVALSPGLGEPTLAEMYEVVIGGWSNGKSAIRREAQGPNSILEVTPAILDCDAMRSFYVTWGDPVGKIALNSGDFGIGTEVLSWTDPTPHAISYVSISTGFGSDGFWQVVPAYAIFRAV